MSRLLRGTQLSPGGKIQLHLSKKGSEGLAYEKDACLGIALGGHEDTLMPVRGTTSGQNGTGHQQSGIAWRLLDVATRVPAARRPQQHRDALGRRSSPWLQRHKMSLRTIPSAKGEAVTADGSGPAPPAPGRWPRSLSEM